MNQPTDAAVSATKATNAVADAPTASRSPSTPTRSGYVAIVGRPNVGKSTLLNRLVGAKISITSRKPQTTRHRLLGIGACGAAQLLYVDTPGLHGGGARAMNRYLNRAVVAGLVGVDVIVWVVDGLQWTDEDRRVLELLRDRRRPVVLAINKIDRIADKRRLLPRIDAVAGQIKLAEVVPLSALKGDGVAALERRLAALLPEAPRLYAEDQITDRSKRFLAAERVREKLTRGLGQELPYALTVRIERYIEEPPTGRPGSVGLDRIDATIWVERPGQKAIVIGAGGAMLKRVGRQARLELEALFGRRISLRLWVKVRDRWSDDEQALNALGYGEA